ncbi:MAG: hypothetical protein AAF558_14950, partial [Verrucomicrobiota bacterium]
AFQEDEEFYTVLFQEKEGLRREDLSIEAWDQRGSQDETPISSWKSHFKPAPPAEQELVGKQDAESELRRLLDKGAPESAKLCRLLALLLERKRMLKLREKISQGDQKLLVYEHTDTQESFMVPDVEFSLSDLDSLREEVIENSESNLFSIQVDSTTPAEPTEVKSS